MTPTDRVAADDRHYLVTGGAGFIGSHVVDALLDSQAARTVTVFDALTYAGSLRNLASHEGDPRLRFRRGDVAALDDLLPLVADADHVLHLAAESDIDRSNRSAQAAVHTNILGTFAVLEATRRTGTPALIVSTDGVYGGGTEGSSFAESDAMHPTNPYAATKAAADMLALAYHATYGLPVTVVRGTNAFGPQQHPEKGMPTFVSCALRGRPIPVFGDGRHRREWLFVTDWVSACLTVMRDGTPGEAYNIGGGTEITNLDLAARICRSVGASTALVSHVADRPAHDRRYGLSWDRLASLGWSPQVPFDEGLSRTVRWYAEHPQGPGDPMGRSRD